LSEGIEGTVGLLVNPLCRRLNPAERDTKAKE
jgi:hypothetical protein